MELSITDRQQELIINSLMSQRTSLYYNEEINVQRIKEIDEILELLQVNTNSLTF